MNHLNQVSVTIISQCVVTVPNSCSDPLNLISYRLVAWKPVQGQLDLDVFPTSSAYAIPIGEQKLCLHVAIFVSRFILKPAWNAHWCVYTRSLIVFIV